MTSIYIFVQRFEIQQGLNIFITLGRQNYQN